jgi:hypothetical protein
MSLPAGECPTIDSLLQLSNLAPNLSRLKHLGTDCVENATPHCCSQVVSMGTCLSVKELLSNGSCIFAYLAIIAQQWVYVLQYTNTMHIIGNLHAVVIICNIIVSNTIILRVKTVGTCIT